MPSRNKLMPNYGWVQNTSNLSTIRNTIDLVPEVGITHSELIERIKQFRVEQNDLPKRWTWDARCRIKAVHATGLVTLDRHIQGYALTELGKKLKAIDKGTSKRRGLRELTREEIKVFKEGLLTNPPVIRVLTLLNISRNDGEPGLNKYDIGKELGFVGDVGFTHIDPYWIVSAGYSFTDKEGDADKWARTILSWLVQVGWVVPSGKKQISDKQIQLYKSTKEVENVLRYDATRIPRHVPKEMLCSDHHPFPDLIQKRRSLLLKYLSEEPRTQSDLVKKINDVNIQFTNQDFEFELLNLRNSGFRIAENGGYYKLIDKIILDLPPIIVKTPKLEGIESLIEELIVKYENTLPIRLVDHLVRYGYDGDKGGQFEVVVAEFFRNLGFDAEYLGQGRGRVTDVLVKYKHPSVYARSYGIIVDAKATSSEYNFPVADKRKMKEYITIHGPKLLSEMIQNHAFTFASSKFVNFVEPNLDEITSATQIKGTAITVEQLLLLGHEIKQRRMAIENLYPFFTTNKLFAIPS